MSNSFNLNGDKKEGNNEKKEILEKIKLENILYKSNPKINNNNIYITDIIDEKNINFKKEIYSKNKELYKNPIKIKFLKDMIKDIYSFYYLDNTFLVFKSIYKILFLIYSNRNKSIVFYNLIDNIKINEIKKAHNYDITNFRHYLDKSNKRDLIISISGFDNNIKLWNINNLDCIYNYEHIYKYGQLFSACFLNYFNQIIILTSNSNFGNIESIKVFDFNGHKLKEIDDSNDNTFYIDIYYDNQMNKNFIITGNFGYIKSYDYIENKIYHKYNANDNRSHNSIIINNYEEIIKLIESSIDGTIRIWNFHSGNLINKIKIKNASFYDICLWNNEYLFVGCEDGTIKLIELKTEKLIKELKSHNRKVLTIKKIIHPLYQNCLLTQGIDRKIKLWIMD